MFGIFLSVTLSFKTYYLELRNYKVDFFNFIPANSHCADVDCGIR